MAYITSVGDNHLDSGASATGLIACNAPQTHSLWVLLSEFNTNVYCIGGAYNTAAGSAIQFGSYNTADFRVWRWGGSILCSITSGLPLPNTYFHCVYTWDGTNSILYIDDVLIESNTNIPQSGVFNQIYMNSYPTGGASETGPNNCISDYRIYNRVLNRNEISTIYNSLGRDNIYTGLIGKWTCDEGTPGAPVVTAYDYSVNRNHLSPIGTNFYTLDSLTLPPLIG